MPDGRSIRKKIWETKTLESNASSLPAKIFIRDIVYSLPRSAPYNCSVSASRPPTDLRKQRNDLTRRLLWLVLFVLVGVGGILIAILYGAQAGMLAVACLLAGAGLIGLLWLIFTLIGKWVGN